jgi:hypothetical protein
MSQEIFLMDSNSFIAPYKSFYSFDFAPGYWNQLENGIKCGRIQILDLVKNEITSGDDELKKWMSSLSFNSIDRRQQNILQVYANVLQYIQYNPCYKPAALTEWSKSNIADPWLIATAKVFGYTIITFEEGKKINPSSPSKNAKIPDVADHFGVKTEKLYYLMRELGFKLN